MSKTMRFDAAILILLFTALPSYAGPCEASIDHVQAQVDAAVDRSAGAGPWMPESIDALRGYQPTPSSVAKAEGPAASGLQHALRALDQARAADQAGNIARCNSALNEARRALTRP